MSIGQIRFTIPQRYAYIPRTIDNSPAIRYQVTAYPLIGRTTEWTQLLQTYEPVYTNQHAGFVAIVQGEAGIGKTRLAEEFLAYVQREGAKVLAARCYEGETNLAYGPIIAGLRSALAQQEDAQWLAALPSHMLSETARLLPELLNVRPDIPLALPLESPGAQSRFFESLRQQFLVLCRGSRPGVLFFDDVHWADSASLELLSYLIRRLADEPINLLVTYRTGQHFAHLSRL